MPWGTVAVNDSRDLGLLSTINRNIKAAEKLEYYKREQWRRSRRGKGSHEETPDQLPPGVSRNYANNHKWIESVLKRTPHARELDIVTSFLYSVKDDKTPYKRSNPYDHHYPVDDLVGDTDGSRRVPTGAYRRNEKFYQDIIKETASQIGSTTSPRTLTYKDKSYVMRHNSPNSSIDPIIQDSLLPIFKQHRKLWNDRKPKDFVDYGVPEGNYGSLINSAFDFRKYIKQVFEHRGKLLNSQRDNVRKWAQRRGYRDFVVNTLPDAYSLALKMIPFKKGGTRFGQIPLRLFSTDRKSFKNNFNQIFTDTKTSASEHNKIRNEISLIKNWRNKYAHSKAVKAFSNAIIANLHLKKLDYYKSTSDSIYGFLNDENGIENLFDVYRFILGPKYGAYSESLGSVEDYIRNLLKGDNIKGGPLANVPKGGGGGLTPFRSGPSDLLYSGDAGIGGGLAISDDDDDDGGGGGGSIVNQDGKGSQIRKTIVRKAKKLAETINHKAENLVATALIKTPSTVGKIVTSPLGVFAKPFWWLHDVILENALVPLYDQQNKKIARTGAGLGIAANVELLGRNTLNYTHLLDNVTGFSNRTIGSIVNVTDWLDGAIQTSRFVPGVSQLMAPGRAISSGIRGAVDWTGASITDYLQGTGYNADLMGHIWNFARGGDRLADAAQIIPQLADKSMGAALIGGGGLLATSLAARIYGRMKGRKYDIHKVNVEITEKDTKQLQAFWDNLTKKLKGNGNIKDAGPFSIAGEVNELNDAIKTRDSATVTRDGRVYPVNVEVIKNDPKGLPTSEIIRDDQLGPPLAKGGVATSATWRMFGEAGPEAVLPLTGRVLGELGRQIVSAFYDTASKSSKAMFGKDWASKTSDKGFVHTFGRELSIVLEPISRSLKSIAEVFNEFSVGGVFDNIKTFGEDFSKSFRPVLQETQYYLAYVRRYVNRGFRRDFVLMKKGFEGVRTRLDKEFNRLTDRFDDRFFADLKERVDSTFDDVKKRTPGVISDLRKVDSKYFGGTGTNFFGTIAEFTKVLGDYVQQEKQIIGESGIRNFDMSSPQAARRKFTEDFQRYITPGTSLREYLINLSILGTEVLPDMIKAGKHFVISSFSSANTAEGVFTDFKTLLGNQFKDFTQTTKDLYSQVIKRNQEIGVAFGAETRTNALFDLLLKPAALTTAKATPLLGLIAGPLLAGQRVADKDPLGARLELASGILGGLGLAPGSLLFSAMQMRRDYDVRKGVGEIFRGTPKKDTFKTLTKAAPLLGIPAGLLYGTTSLLRGDVIGAGMEVASGFAGGTGNPLLSMGISALPKKATGEGLGAAFGGADTFLKGKFGDDYKKRVAFAGLKIGLKMIPGFGAAFATGFAVQRLMKGDVGGAALEFISGLPSLLGPGGAMLQALPAMVSGAAEMIGMVAEMTPIADMFGPAFDAFAEKGLGQFLLDGIRPFLDITGLSALAEAVGDFGKFFTDITGMAINIPGVKQVGAFLGATNELMTNTITSIANWGITAADSTFQAAYKGLLSFIGGINPNFASGIANLVEGLTPAATLIGAVGGQVISNVWLGIRDVMRTMDKQDGTSQERRRRSFFGIRFGRVTPQEGDEDFIGPMPATEEEKKETRAKSSFQFRNLFRKKNRQKFTKKLREKVLGPIGKRAKDAVTQTEFVGSGALGALSGLPAGGFFDLASATGRLMRGDVQGGLLELNKGLTRMAGGNENAAELSKQLFEYDELMKKNKGDVASGGKGDDHIFQNEGDVNIHDNDLEPRWKAPDIPKPASRTEAIPEDEIVDKDGKGEGNLIEDAMDLVRGRRRGVRGRLFRRKLTGLGRGAKGIAGRSGGFIGRAATGTGRFLMGAGTGIRSIAMGTPGVIAGAKGLGAAGLAKGGALLGGAKGLGAAGLLKGGALLAGAKGALLPALAAAGPIGWGALGIGALAGGAYMLHKKAQKDGTNIPKAFGDAIKSGLQWLWDKLKSILPWTDKNKSTLQEKIDNLFINHHDNKTKDDLPIIPPKQPRGQGGRGMAGGFPSLPSTDDTVTTNDPEIVSNTDPNKNSAWWIKRKREKERATSKNKSTSQQVKDLVKVGANVLAPAVGATGSIDAGDGFVISDIKSTVKGDKIGPNTIVIPGQTFESLGIDPNNSNSRFDFQFQPAQTTDGFFGLGKREISPSKVIVTDKSGLGFNPKSFTGDKDVIDDRLLFNLLPSGHKNLTSLENAEAMLNTIAFAEHDFRNLNDDIWYRTQGSHDIRDVFLRQIGKNWNPSMGHPYDHTLTPGSANYLEFETNQLTGEDQISGAMGPFQIMPQTWYGWLKRKGLPRSTPFTIENQMALALDKVKMRMGSKDFDEALKYGPTIESIHKLRPEWASITDEFGQSYYSGQGKVKTSEFVNYYNKIFGRGTNLDNKTLEQIKTGNYNPNPTPNVIINSPQNTVVPTANTNNPPVDVSVAPGFNELGSHLYTGDFLITLGGI